MFNNDNNNNNNNNNNKNFFPSGKGSVTPDSQYGTTQTKKISIKMQVQITFNKNCN